MSLEHKRPLFAFAVVVIACVVILANAIRSEALVSFLRSGASHVAAGLPFGETAHEPGRRGTRAVPAAPSVPGVEVAVEAPQVAAAVLRNRPARTAQPVGSGHQHVAGQALGGQTDAGHVPAAQTGQGDQAHHRHGDHGRHLGHVRGHEKVHGLRGQVRARVHALRAHGWRILRAHDDGRRLARPLGQGHQHGHRHHH